MTTYIPAGPQSRVNEARAGIQAVSSSAALEDGGYVLIWASLPGTGYLFKGQRYDSNGDAVGSEFQVASLATSNQSSFTSTTGLQDGGFIVAWENGHNATDGSGSAVQAQRFDSSGQPAGAAFVVNELTTGNQNGVALTTLADGSFVATWTTNQPASGGTLNEVKGRLFDSSGAALGSEFLVNTTTVGNQTGSSLAALQTGGFLATWLSGSGASGSLNGQFFDSAGAKLGGEIALAGAGPGYPLEPSVTELADGRIVIAWRNVPDSGSGDTINGRIFDSSGAPIGGEFLISNPGGNPQAGSPQVEALPDGGFVATWSHPGGTDVSTAVWARIYDPSGTPGTSFLANTAAALFEGGSRTLVTNAGDIVVAWSTSFDVINTDVSARFIALNTAPVIQSDGGGATASFTVAEDQRVVTQIVADDRVGPAPVSYSISGGADAALFAIELDGPPYFRRRAGRRRAGRCRSRRGLRSHRLGRRWRAFRCSGPFGDGRRHRPGPDHRLGRSGLGARKRGGRHPGVGHRRGGDLRHHRRRRRRPLRDRLCDRPAQLRRRPEFRGPRRPRGGQCLRRRGDGERRRPERRPGALRHRPKRQRGSGLHNGGLPVDH